MVPAACLVPAACWAKTPSLTQTKINAVLVKKEKSVGQKVFSRTCARIHEPVLQTLQTRHDEKDAACMADLAETERHREWLWRVKYDLDFTEMEQVGIPN